MSSSYVVSTSNWTLHRRRHHHPPLKLTPLSSTQLPASPNGRVVSSLSFRVRTALSTTTTSLVEEEDAEEKFDWYSQWYPVMPLCDIDKRRPHVKMVTGLDLVVWWDRNEGEGASKVFDDTCPHRLAPLSEGRIDRTGRQQCGCHGLCFDGSGDCMFIPQAQADDPPVNASKRACVAAYPTTVQHDIVWFWPNADTQYKDIILQKKPPYMPELDDPSFTKLSSNRDIPYGYEVLIENLMVMRTSRSRIMEY